MSWRAFCSHTAAGGGKFFFHPSEAHSAGMTKWLKNNYHPLMQLNPGWTFKPREVLTNNPHVSMTFANGVTRSIALYNATEEEVEEAMSQLITYGRVHAPRDNRAFAEHEPNVVTYSPATHGFGNSIKSGLAGVRDLNWRIQASSPQERETFDRPGQIRPLRFGQLNRGRGDQGFSKVVSNNKRSHHGKLMSNHAQLL
eukprot:TRINITY_DN30019_c0_g1_i1.p1 TRINITY_DN30019_c0_g1~~TRINITY_DN30019_c0_g1_i1.p1  ORF type:complete len:198 (+),score=60.50 TRINITY_DN30019_c0_g1_i1:62-655(+)